MNEDFTLPGAENFAQYLSTSLEGRLTAEGPIETVNGKVELIWKIYQNEIELGTYTVEYATTTAERDPAKAMRIYDGRIPGYVNPSIAGMNEHLRADQAPADVSCVKLIFAYLQGPQKPMQPTRSDWKRDDGHKDISFP